MAEQVERLEQGGHQDYKGFAQKNDFQHDLGLVVLPVASRTAAHRVIRLHGGYATRRVTWRADRTGRPPIIPAAADTEGDKLLSASVVPRLPVPMRGEAGYEWSVSGEYVYVQNTPRVAGETTFPVGNYPFVVEPAASVAEDIARPFVQQHYVGAPAGERFPTFIEYVAGRTDLRDPEWIWPFLALPSKFTSTHIIGG